MSEATAEKTEKAEVVSTEAAATESAKTEKVDGEDALGDKGKKALDTMKAERNAAKIEVQTFKDQLAALQAKIDGKEAEHAATEATRKVETEALSKANDRILKAEVRVAAATKLNDPADALRFIDLSEFEVGSDGEVDATAISAAIDNLINEKPYLAAQGGKRFQGTADGGARNDAAKPTQLTRIDLTRMSPQEIVQAQADGRLSELMGSK